MRAVTVVAVLLLVGASLSAAIWMTRGHSNLTEAKPAPTAATENPLPISKTGPWPAVQKYEPQYNFGAMELGETGKHVFRIVNEGQVPLRLKEKSSTCKCTLSKVAGEEIPPGESGEILLEWKPIEVTDNFMQSAEVWSNDPKLPMLSLRIEGYVVERLRVSPPGGWEMPVLSDANPTSFTGILYSNTVDSFKILSAKSENPLMTAEVQPMPRAMLDEVHAKVGYTVKVTVQPNKTVGAFSYLLALKTDMLPRLENGEIGTEPIELKIPVRGSRRSAVHLIGGDYIEEKSLVTLGTFEATVGRSVDLRMIVNRCPTDGFKILDVVTDPPALKILVTPVDDAPQGKPQHFQVKISYPPEAPRDERSVAAPGTISLTTNHPEVKEIKLSVSFSAY